MFFQSLLSTHSAKERENKKLLEEIQHLLSQPTAKVSNYISDDGNLVLQLLNLLCCRSQDFYKNQEGSELGIFIFKALKDFLILLNP